MKGMETKIATKGEAYAGRDTDSAGQREAFQTCQSNL